MKTSRFLAPALPLAAALLASACAPVPHLSPAPQPIAAGDIAASQSLPGRAEGLWPGDGWWTAYNDPQLTALIEEGLAKSPDVAIAKARLDRANAMAEAARGATLPSVDAQGGVTLQKQSYNMGYPKAFVPQGFNDYGNLAVSAGFDLDLWGKNRAALAAARGDARAAEVDAAQARLMLATAIANAYFDLGGLAAQRDLDAGIAKARGDSADLVAKRVGQGLDNEGSRHQAEAARDAAKVDLAAVSAQVMVRRHQLAALVGAGPDRGLSIVPPHVIDLPPRPLPADVTTDLVGRRPDVVAARERVESAASRIKVARAAFYPSIKLEALVGLQALGLKNLFSSDSIYSNLGPSFSLPIFHGGQLQGNYRGARATYDEAVATYDKTVLAAYQDTTDAVSGRAAVLNRLAIARQAAASADAALAVAQARYKAGLSTYIDVLAVEERAIQARLSVAALETSAQRADVGLVQALGGGFAAPSIPSTQEHPK